jgi:hydroxysqualene dehydroxylase
MHYDVAIVGAGWAGLAAAITCIEAGKRVVLFDAAPQPGGRARHQSIQFNDDLTVDLDNGQHLIIGAYTSCITLMEKVGAAPLLRNRLSLLTESGICLESAAPTSALASILDAILPALAKRGLSFLRAKGFRNADKRAIVSALIKLSVGRKSARWDNFCTQNETVTALLQRLAQPQTLQQQFWNPLCIATMNTLPSEADAATFCRVLRDTFGNPIFEASDFLLPKTHLGASFPEPAVSWLEDRGCAINLRTAVTTLRRGENDGDNETLVINGEVSATKVILAMPPDNAHRLLKNLLSNSPIEEAKTTSALAGLNLLQSFDYLPIATVYLAWHKSPGQRHPAQTIPTIFMLDDLRASGRPGQWLFNRSEIDSATVSYCLASVVISAWDASLSLDGLSGQVQQQVASIKNLPLPQATFAKAIVDKKATLACTPNRPKLCANYLQQANFQGLFKNILLAGDYCYPLYPATLEGAVRSGIASAELT